MVGMASAQHRRQASPTLFPQVYWLVRPHHRHKVRVYAPPLNSQELTRAPHVLYLHGAGNDGGFLFAPFVRHLTARQMVVVSVDLEGHGRDSEGVWTPHHHEFIRDVLAFLATLNISKVHLLGHSLGGAMALMSYQQDPHRYVSLTCLAVPVRVKFRQLYRELRLVTGRCYWRYVRSFGLKASLPAMGRLGRRAFPIRLAPGQGYSYPRLLARWIHAQNLAGRIGQLSCAHDQAGGVLWVEARWDGLAVGLAPRTRAQLKAKGGYVRARTTHLGVLIDEAVSAATSQHILAAHREYMDRQGHLSGGSCSVREHMRTPG